MLKNIFFLILILNVIFSCSTKKNIVYTQDIFKVNDTKYEYKSHRISPFDVLRISISSENIQASEVYSNAPQFTETRESLIFKGFKVDNDGYIYYQSLGKIYVQEKTTSELSQYLYDKITELGYLSDPKVDVKVLNLNFTILGEVKNPGKYNYDEDNLNILEAIGMAGDLTILGNRKNIKMIREKYDGEKRVFEIDLTGTEFFENETFQISSGDIIIVNPNSTRVKNAGIIGNSGTLLSLLSFLLSSLIVINNN